MTQSPGACTAVGTSLLSGLGPFPMRSPRESIIPNSVYWSSPRIEGDLARALPDLSRYGDYFDQIDTCFGDAMMAAQQIHGHRK